MATWPRETSSHATQVGKAFKTHLKDVAETFANHERVDSVSRKHVDESFAALARMGLQSKTWWQRTDTWTAAGALLFGLSFSMPDVCGPLCGLLGLSETVSDVLSVSLLVIMMGLGMGLYFWARHRGGLPSKPGTA